jgi:hypothetical protein
MLSIIDQHYVLIIIPLLDTQAPTCFGIHVPSSGSLLSYLKAEMVTLFVRYCECWWPVCTGSCSFVCYVVQLSCASNTRVIISA